MNVERKPIQNIIGDTTISKGGRLNVMLEQGHSRRETYDYHEQAIRKMLKGWTGYADAVTAKYESKIGDDYVLGPEWEAIGKGILGLLNGVVGNLDCGDMDAFIRQCLTEEGFDGDNA